VAEDTLHLVLPDGFHAVLRGSAGILFPERRPSKLLQERVLSSAARAEAVVVVGVGLDLVELERVERALARWGDRLIAKLMDEPESRRLPPPGPDRVLAMALAITGKEAAAKAIGTGWSRGVFWRHVVVDPGPPPRLTLVARAAEVARSLGSQGSTRARFERRGTLVLGEVWLLA
jgi:holo-[acyl-carrier protein] synthase